MHILLRMACWYSAILRIHVHYLDYHAKIFVADTRELKST
jgi:hypothetical protein